MKKNVYILGGNISGLYAAIKCIENGNNVTIIDKRCNLGGIKYNNYEYFNKTHNCYIQLLNKFNIRYDIKKIDVNDKLNSIISYIIQKSKLIPKKNLISQSFISFCKILLILNDYEILKNSIDNFEYIFSNICAMDAISLFINDLLPINEYCILRDNIELLIKKMIDYLSVNGAKFILNTEIFDIRIMNNEVKLNSIESNYNCNALVVTLSKDNLLKYKIFNKEHRNILNNVTSFNINPISIIDKMIVINKTMKTYLLDKLHIVYPEDDKNKIYLWNIGINNIIIREKIKNMLSKIYICSESYSRNIFFINYSLETVDITVQKNIT
jgi:hypothetical protein